MSLLSVLVPLLGAILFTAPLHYWLWRRLVRDPQWPSRWHRLFTIGFLIPGIGMPLSVAATFILPRPGHTLLAWPTFLWMGWAFILIVATLGIELFRLTRWITTRATGKAPDPSRRLLVGRVMSAGVGVLGVGTTAFGVGRALGPVPVQPVHLNVPRLGPGFDGMRIVQLTDIHVGPTIGRDFVEHLVTQTMNLEPDLIAITGDLVDGTVENLGDAVRALAGLRAPLGVYFVTGNHEYISGAGPWLELLPTLGIRVLQNERVRLSRNGSELDVVGVNDYSAARFDEAAAPDLPAALAGRDPDVPALLLAHQPRAAEEAASLGIDVQLSGHTHAGQIWPFRYAVRLTTPYVVGLYRIGDMQLYVSPGTGYWGPPMRVATQAEITHLTLRAGAPLPSPGVVDAATG